MPCQMIWLDTGACTAKCVKSASSVGRTLFFACTFRQALGYGPLGVDTFEDFPTHIRGGKWTFNNKHVPCDRILGEARQGLSIDWCRAYGLNCVAPFTLSNYSEAHAGKMALEWRRRMQHFFSLWVQQDNLQYYCTPGDLDSYMEDLEWAQWVSFLHAPSHSFYRATGLRSLAPSARPIAAVAEGVERTFFWDL